MKKVILIGCVLVLIMTGVGIAKAPWFTKYTTVNTGTASVVDKSCYLKGFLITTDGTNAVTFDVYDYVSGTSNTTYRMLPSMTVTTSATNRVTSISLPWVKAARGIFVQITCSGTVSYQTFYDD